MKIILENTSKRFTREWIFKNINLTLEKGNAYAVTGPNGSGKSTLLQVISGFIPPTHGKILYLDDQQKSIEAEDFYQYISSATPALELIEDFTLKECLQFHFNFKKLVNGKTIKDLILEMDLLHAVDRQIRYFSSGMRQRVKLATCFFADVPVMMLDEPTTNLDAAGVGWYEKMLESNLDQKIVLICSNLEREFRLCNRVINMSDYKK